MRRSRFNAIAQTKQFINNATNHKIMRPLTYYCDNHTTQYLSKKHGAFLEGMSIQEKNFLVFLIGNRLFSGCPLYRFAKDMSNTSNLKHLNKYLKTVESLSFCSNSELAKILEFLAGSLSEYIYREERKTADSNN